MTTFLCLSSFHLGIEHFASQFLKENLDKIPEIYLRLDCRQSDGLHLLGEAGRDDDLAVPLPQQAKQLLLVRRRVNKLLHTLSENPV